MESLFKILEQTADGVYAVDGSQRIIYWSPAAEAMLGYTADEVKGRLCYEVLRGLDDHDRAHCGENCGVHRAVQAGETVNHFNLCTRTKGGMLYWIDVSILGVADPGNDTSVVAVHLFRDATQRKQQEQFARQILQAAQDWQRQQVSTAPSHGAEPAPQQLTEREREVLALLARGQSTAAMARDLSISSATVRNHIQNILQKFHVHSRAAAVAYAFEHGIVAPE